MKILLITLALLSISCSAVFANKSELGINPCDWSIYTDAGLSGAAVAGSMVVKNKDHADAELQRVSLTMLATGLATSAIIGYGHCYLRGDVNGNVR